MVIWYIKKFILEKKICRNKAYIYTLRYTKKATGKKVKFIETLHIYTLRYMKKAIQGKK